MLRFAFERVVVFGTGVLFLVFGCVWGGDAGEDGVQYVVLNRMPGGGWHQGRPETVEGDDFLEVTRHFPGYRTGKVRLGVSCIVSYLNTGQDLTVRFLKRVLECAEETDTPILIKLDGESWWGARGDLWNWWAPEEAGYDPANRENVEWTGWDNESAIRIAWRNWGRQLRVLPPPNLMSRRYRQACREQMDVLLPIVMAWWRRLPEEKKDLLIGINVGWESSIGVNAWYYPDGNALLERDAKDDPREGLNTKDATARGQVQIGYAAVKTAGIRNSGKITERDMYEVVRRHLEDLSKQVARHGFGREKIFTHGAGWKDEELLYDAAVNGYSCPGWSFYKHAADVSKDAGVQRALTKNTGPYWAASEWLLMKPAKTELWREALERTLADRRCRFVCIYNWEGIRGKEPILRAIRDVTE